MAGKKESTVLLTSFCSFYKEVVKLKNAVKKGDTADLHGEEDPSASEDSVKQLAYMISLRLTRYLETECRKFRQGRSESEVNAFSKAMYAMASLADEIFILRLDWLGSTYWQNFLVEEKLFQSCISGSNLFVQIEDLIEKNEKTSLNKDLASVYLLTIRLGFCGRFEDKKGRKRLNRYADSLLEYTSAKPEGTAISPLFPDAWKHVKSNAEEVRIGALAPWVKFFGFGFVIYLIILSVVWEITIMPLTRLF